MNIAATILSIGAGMLVSISVQAMDGKRDAAAVGVAKGIEVISPKGSRLTESRVWTIEGKSYQIYGTLQGVEGSALAVGLGERNNVRYLCGGFPRSCAVLTD